MHLKSTAEYREMSSAQAMEQLSTSAEGLSSAEAENRKRLYGYNEIVEVRRSVFLQFIKRYWGPMPWLLELAIVLTLILRHDSESIIIFSLLTLNALIGYLQSQNSQKAVRLLKKQLEVKARVLRDGGWLLKEAREIVPGDIITIKLGDVVPADACIIKGEISADESALTGESLPKNLHQSDIVYSGSVVKGGEAKCVAVNTGENTYFGKTVDLVKKARPKSKQEKLMLDIVKYMMYLGIAASVIVSAYAVYLHKDFLFILSFIVIFLIGAIPVALPAVLTIVQAVGAMDLSAKGVLVTRLDSIEDASSVDVFCFDKTGTITQNKLSVVDCIAFEKYSEEDVVTMASLASEKNGMDAIDLAILHYAESLSVHPDTYKKISYVPFDPKNKRTEAVVQYGGKEYKIFKGAPQIIAGLCADMQSKTADAVRRAVDDYSRKGYRTIAVAATEYCEPVRPALLGLLAIADPPRDDSESMISEIKSLGIRPMMLTGDNIAIAKEISSQVGIGDKIKRIGELENISSEEQRELIQNSDGFAEVYPEDKYRIVKLLQDGGHMVGMTGDGVNDSPALKQAELGTAVSEATDVAKASASIILTKPGLGEIIDAVKVSRETYQRMLTWVINKIIKVVEVVVLFTVGFFWLHDVVISLLGMSLLVFANDFVTMSIATDNVKSTDSPNQWDMRNITAASLLLGICFALEDLLIVFIGLYCFHLDFDRLRALVLLSLVFNTQFRILLVRERKHFWSSAPSKTLLLITIVTTIAFALLSAFGLMIPQLLAGQILAVLGIAAAFMVSIDIFKYHLFKKFNI